MFLAIDIGNTNVVIGCIEGRQIVDTVRLATDPLKTSDQYCMDLKNVCSMFAIDLDCLEGSIIASVVPPLLNSFRTALRKLIGKAPLVVEPGLKTGMNILMDDPAQVGADLIVGAVAAARDYGKPAIVIDMGTATTLCAVDSAGAFIGGTICPGLRLSSEVLSGKTAQLPGISLEAPKSAIGKNTVEAMRSGIMLGTACMLDGMIDHYEKEIGSPCHVIATGGLARFVLPMCKHEIVYDRNLVLQGLLYLYEMNRR